MTRPGSHTGQSSRTVGQGPEMARLVSHSYTVGLKRDGSWVAINGPDSLPA